MDRNSLKTVVTALLVGLFALSLTVLFPIGEAAPIYRYPTHSLPLLPGTFWFRQAEANPAGGAAIASDATSNTGPRDNSSTLQWNHTVGAGSNRALFVGIGSYSSDAVTAVTYGGVSLTKIASAGPNANATMSVWYLAAPATGTAQIDVSSAGTYKLAGAVSLANVNQSTPSEANAPANGTGANASGSVTPATANAWVIDFIYWQAAANPSAPTWDTVTAVAINDTTNGHSFGMAVEGPVAASSQTNTWTSSATGWQSIKIAVKPL